MGWFNKKPHSDVHFLEGCVYDLDHRFKTVEAKLFMFESWVKLYSSDTGNYQKRFCALENENEALKKRIETADQAIAASFKFTDAILQDLYKRIHTLEEKPNAKSSPGRTKGKMGKKQGRAKSSVK